MSFHSRQRHHLSVRSLRLSVCHGNASTKKTFTTDVRQMQWRRHHMTVFSSPFRLFVSLTNVARLWTPRVSPRHKHVWNFSREDFSRAGNIWDTFVIPGLY